MAKKEVHYKVYSQRMKYLIFFSNHKKYPYQLVCQSKECSF